MARSKTRIGPWLREDFSTFLNIPVGPEPHTEAVIQEWKQSGALIKFAGRSFNYAEFVNAGWAIRKQHPVYKALNDDPNFRQAWLAFSNARKHSRSKVANWPNTPFVFLNVYVAHAGCAYSGRSMTPVRPGMNSKDRRKASAAIDVLLSLSERKLDPILGFETIFRELACKLTAIQRKPYAGSRAYQRQLLKDFAASLVRRCGVRSPAVLLHFAAMVNFECDTKMAQRYMAEQAGKWKAIEAEFQTLAHEG